MHYSKCRESLESYVAERFGIRLAAFPGCVVDRLLSRLPGHWSVDDAAVYRTVCSAVSIGETMFLRDNTQFDALVSLIPGLDCVRKGSAPRLWSAGCSTGEEAYSLAARLMRAGFSNASILGTDVNESSLELAKRGHYRFWSMRAAALDANRDWLHEEGIEVCINESVRKMVSFETLNLVSDKYPRADIVFCRNVLLYFDFHASCRVYRRMAEALEDNGFLFTSPTDPQPPADCFCPVRIGETTVFRKTVDRHETAPPDRGPQAKPALTLLGTAVAFAAAGNHDEAISILDACKETELFDPGLHITRALIALEGRRFSEGLEAARRAAMLAPDEALPNFLLGAALHESGERRIAADRLRIARLLLLRQSDLKQPLPYGHGMTGKQLMCILEGYACVV